MLKLTSSVVFSSRWDWPWWLLLGFCCLQANSVVLQETETTSEPTPSLPLKEMWAYLLQPGTGMWTCVLDLPLTLLSTTAVTAVHLIKVILIRVFQVSSSSAPPLLWISFPPAPALPRGQQSISWISTCPNKTIWICSLRKHAGSLHVDLSYLTSLLAITSGMVFQDGLSVVDVGRCSWRVGAEGSAWCANPHDPVLDNPWSIQDFLLQ